MILLLLLRRLAGEGSVWCDSAATCAVAVCGAVVCNTAAVAAVCDPVVYVD